MKIFHGTTIGVNHTKTKDILISIPNQDSYKIINKNGITIGVVFDGCSQGEHNEIGSRMASEIFTKSLFRSIHLYGGTITIESALRVAQSKLLLILSNMSKYMNPFNYFMFTILGFIVYNKKIYYFSCGDGTYGYKKKNEQLLIKELGPFDIVPYIYKKVQTEDSKYDINILEILDEDEIEFGFIGTDGLNEFIKLHGSIIPLKNTFIVSIEELCTSDRIEQKNYITGYLKKINLDRSGIIDNKLVFRNGLINDDCTLIVYRR